ncbi:DUF2878 domain-containing protein [Halieaceae bacterium IMCC14734]|uniref:DUF2878 domain-containing protein n=1 Tax=Candidatus Litorirhabdus singularis TaxID=2518993 RepID=A0ABT3TBZ6_9GAMM|nr:DUF2878 domain-containing protein [Candidatus Litorirhabdus singularis]MCX2979809.1 DUF2878 domain-containing protein [Candidatus Litorirhabdus singularis]
MGKGLLNGMIFNVSWLVLLLTHSNVVAPLLVIAHLALHRVLFLQQQREWLLIALITAGGLLLDQLIFAASILTVDDTRGWPPLWLGCLWPIFATTLNHVFKALQQHLLLASLLGAVGGTGSYIAGVGMTSVSFGTPIWSPLAIALIWAILMPLMCIAAGRLMAPEGSNDTAIA